MLKKKISTLRDSIAFNVKKRNNAKKSPGTNGNEKFSGHRQTPESRLINGKGIENI